MAVEQIESKIRQLFLNRRSDDTVISLNNNDYNLYVNHLSSKKEIKTENTFEFGHVAIVNSLLDNGDPCWI